MDEDGPITGGVEGVQLTWMDVKIGDWVVAPRHGKPVEVQALWVRVFGGCRRFGRAIRRAGLCGAVSRGSRPCDRIIPRAVLVPNRRGYLFDVVDGLTGDDASPRPNQIFALALDDQLVTDVQAKQILNCSGATSHAGRAADAGAGRYSLFASYEGACGRTGRRVSPRTVGRSCLAFVTAWVKTHGDSPEVRREARQFLQGLSQHLEEGLPGAGVGNLRRGTSAPGVGASRRPGPWRSVTRLIEDVGMTREVRRSCRWMVSWLRPFRMFVLSKSHS